MLASEDCCEPYNVRFEQINYKHTCSKCVRACPIRNHSHTFEVLIETVLTELLFSQAMYGEQSNWQNLGCRILQVTGDVKLSQGGFYQNLSQ